jgi:hypothetical protein
MKLIVLINTIVSVHRQLCPAMLIIYGALFLQNEHIFMPLFHYFIVVEDRVILRGKNYKMVNCY